MKMTLEIEIPNRLHSLMINEREQLGLTNSEYISNFIRTAYEVYVLDGKIKEIENGDA